MQSQQLHFFVQEAEKQVEAVRLEDPEVEGRRKWRKLKDMSVLLLGLIKSCPTGQVSLCKLVLQPTYWESEYRFTALSILVG